MFIEQYIIGSQSVIEKTGYDSSVKELYSLSNIDENH